MNANAPLELIFTATAIPPLPLLAGFALSFIEAPTLRRWLFAFWAALPLLAFVTLGATDDCIPANGERCFWFGFGLVILAGLWAAIWIPLSLAGLFAKRLFTLLRKRA